MPERFAFEDIALSVRGAPHRSARQAADDEPFRILLLGDFSGRNSRAVCEPLGGRPIRKVDVDNFDDALARTRATLRLDHGDPPITVSFAALNDFHPDKLLRCFPSLEKLRATRAALGHPSTAREAAQMVASWAGQSAPAARAAGSERGEETFARLLGIAPETSAQKVSATPGGQVDEFIRQMVAPHIVPERDPNIDAMLAAVDAAMTLLLRALLHDPRFQELEATWRALDFLVRNIETDETLSIHFLDVARSEIAADLRSDNDLARTQLFKLLVEGTVQTPGAASWALIAADYSFNANPEDADLLARLGKIAAAAGAPFLAGAEREFIEVARSAREHPQAWGALRRTPQARSIGLTAPRFLLRLPYGASTEEIDTFPFEEIPASASEREFLWGNPAFACACMIGQSFREDGWNLSPGSTNELNGLPLHTFEVDGEKRMTPCAEVWLTEDEAEKLLADGIMPLLSIRGRDAARLLRFQSIAQPAAALAGRWA